jgi:hypothetical protein
MADNLKREWSDSCPIIDRPSHPSIHTKIDHSSCQGEHRDIHILEILCDAIHTDEETGSLKFLRSCCPFHVNAYEMAEQCFGQVEGDATEEEDKNRSPADSLDDRIPKLLLVKTVSYDAVSNRCLGRQF